MPLENARETARAAAELLDLPFDQYQRYRVVERIAAALGLAKSAKILDVGGYPGLIADFLPGYETTIVDLVEAELPNYVRYDGTRLPFTDGAFDLVCSCDVLEHVPSPQRPEFVSELARVSGSYIIVTAPFYDERTRLSEEILSEYIERVLHQRHEVLMEHINNGLPDLAATLAMLQADDWSSAVIPSGYLYRWLPMMMVKHEILSHGESEMLHKRLDRLYNLEFGDRDYVSPAYRQVIFAATSTRRADVVKVENEFSRLTEMSGASEPDLFGLFASLRDNSLHLEMEKFVKYSNDVLLRQIDELHEQLVEARQKVVEQENHARNLQTELDTKFSRRLWSAARKLLNR